MTYPSADLPPDTVAAWIMLARIDQALKDDEAALLAMSRGTLGVVQALQAFMDAAARGYGDHRSPPATRPS